jgi:hypothetical protein
MKKHQRNSFIASMILTSLAGLAVLILLVTTTGCGTTATPLCRHVVLSQYAAFVDAGYETELWHMKNKNPERANGFKYHVAVRIKKDGKWLWVEQPKLVYTTTTQAPSNTDLLRKMEFSEVAGWVKKK